MRGLLTTLLFVAIAAGQAAPPDELFVLEIAGKRHELIGGKQVEIDIHGKKTAVKVTPVPHKELRTEWFSFRFPRDHAYSYDGGRELAGVQIWHVEHEVSFLQLVQTALDTEKAALDLFLEDALVEGAQRAPVKLEIGGAEWKGARIDDRSDEAIPRRTTVLTRKSGGKVWVLYIFDVPGKDGAMSKEFRPAYELFLKTFKMR
ncbi:MAG: hypothetical protein ACYTHK_06470 [Planctomycetota bacterium]